MHVVKIVGNLVSLWLAVILPAWFFWCVIDSLRTGRARSLLGKKVYMYRQHPWAFARTLCARMLLGLLLLYFGMPRVQVLMQTWFPSE